MPKGFAYLYLRGDFHIMNFTTFCFLNFGRLLFTHDPPATTHDIHDPRHLATLGEKNVGAWNMLSVPHPRHPLIRQDNFFNVATVLVVTAEPEIKRFVTLVL